MEQAEPGQVTELVAELARFAIGVTLTDIGSVASIGGLIAALFVLYNVQNIRSYYTFAARVPALADGMKKHVSNLSSFLNDFKSFEHQIREELAAAEVTAGSLSRKLRGRTRKRVREKVKALDAAIREQNKGRLKENEVRAGGWTPFSGPKQAAAKVEPARLKTVLSPS